MSEAVDLAEAWTGHHIRLMARTESPIERALLSALLEQSRTRNSAFQGELVFSENDVRWESWMRDTMVADEPGADFVFWLQASVILYRVDFLLLDRRANKPIWYVIECDGHDFHERTKEQAARDRHRDRSMTALGLRVLRYTGSEIHADSMGCAVELGTYLDMGRG